MQLSNAVREAANYGATNPTNPVGMLARANAERNSQSQAGQQNSLTYPENLTTNCATPSDPPVPISCALSPGGGGAGNTLTVTLRAPFTFLTPLIGGFFGGSLQVSSSATVAVLNSVPGSGTTNSERLQRTIARNLHGLRLRSDDHA